MNALELKNRIKTWDNNTTFLKLTAISILITGVIFPINLSLNPNVDPIVYEYPFLLGFGFVAFVLAVMVAFVCGSIFTLLILDSYLIFSPKILNSTRKTVSNLISKDEELLDRWADGILSRTAKSNQKYDDPKFEELENKFERHHNERMENERLYLNHNNRLANELEKAWEKNARLENKVESLETRIETVENRQKEELESKDKEIEKLKQEKSELEKKESEKIQEIGDKAQSNNNTENSSVKKDNQFDEDL